MRLLRNSLLVALLVALCALVASASSFAGPIEDCADDGQIQGNYTNQQKQQALKNLPSDLSEYSDCAELLNTPNAKGPGSGSGGGGSGGGGGTTTTTTTQPSAAAKKASAADRARRQRAKDKIDKLSSGGKPKLGLDGDAISPGDAGLYDLASATHAIPTPIVLALIAVALLTLAGLTLATRRRYPALAGRVTTPLSRLGHRVARLRR